MKREHYCSFPRMSAAIAHIKTFDQFSLLPLVGEKILLLKYIGRKKHPNPTRKSSRSYTYTNLNDLLGFGIKKILFDLM